MEKGRLMDIAWSRVVYLKPIVYFPKSKQTRELGVSSRAFWTCLCRCGAFVKASTTALKRLKTISCSECSRQAEAELFASWEADIVDDSYRMGLTRTSFDDMHWRVKNDPNYANVKIYSAWCGAGGFDQFVKDKGLRKRRGLTLERIDPKGDYAPANTEWADDPTQRRNKTTSVIYNVGGKRVNLADLAAAVESTSAKVKVKITRLLNSGLSPDEAAERVIADWQSAQCAA